MKIGCPKEVKSQEFRVGLVPSSVKEFVVHGHDVFVEKGCGAGINFSDDEYRSAGAVVVDTAEEVFEKAEMIIKVKEPQPQEFPLIKDKHILFTYLHLAPDPDQAKALKDSRCVAIAYETVTGADGRSLPLLAPMSEVAGRLSVMVGTYHLQRHFGGTGRLISGIPGVLPAKVLVIGGGVSGFNAARIAVGMGADVTILEKNHDRLRFLDDYFGASAKTIYSSQDVLERWSAESDLIIGAVLIPGGAAPKLIKRDMLQTMQRGTVMVDIAIDQGGCFETSHPTTHDDPVYNVDDIVHYCVANMPGAVPLSSALALNHAVLPYALEIADSGWKEALTKNKGLRAGLNVCEGDITHKEVAEALKMDYVYPEVHLDS